MNKKTPMTEPAISVKKMPLKKSSYCCHSSGFPTLPYLACQAKK